jgi:hypothetical protein
VENVTFTSINSEGGALGFDENQTGASHQQFWKPMDYMQILYFTGYFNQM